MDKYKYGKYHEGYFRGGSNIDIKLITCEDKVDVLEILQSYVLHCYHVYILHPGIDITKAMIRQKLYWPVIRKAIWKEVKHCDT